MIIFSFISLISFVVLIISSLNFSRKFKHLNRYSKFEMKVNALLIFIFLMLNITLVWIKYESFKSSKDMLFYSLILSVSFLIIYVPLKLSFYFIIFILAFVIAKNNIVISISKKNNFKMIRNKKIRNELIQYIILLSIVIIFCFLMLWSYENFITYYTNNKIRTLNKTIKIIPVKREILLCIRNSFFLLNFLFFLSIVMHVMHYFDKTNSLKNKTNLLKNKKIFLSKIFFLNHKYTIWKNHKYVILNDKTWRKHIYWSTENAYKNNDIKRINFLKERILYDLCKNKINPQIYKKSIAILKVNEKNSLWKSQKSMCTFDKEWERYLIKRINEFQRELFKLFNAYLICWKDIYFNSLEEFLELSIKINLLLNIVQRNHLTEISKLFKIFDFDESEMNLLEYIEVKYNIDLNAFILKYVSNILKKMKDTLKHGDFKLEFNEIELEYLFSRIDDDILVSELKKILH